MSEGSADRYAGSKRVTDLLALSNVPRWSIVDHCKHQTVGDHVYRVMVIATELAERLSIVLDIHTIMHILHHDAEESRTGDIPTPFKRLGAGSDEEMRATVCPWTERWPNRMDAVESRLFQLADLIEAATFIKRYGVGSHAAGVAALMRIAIEDALVGWAGWHTEVWRLVKEIEEDAGR